MSLPRWCPCGAAADDHGTCPDCDGARFEASRRTLAAGGSRAEELEALGRAEDERGWPRPEESLRAALGERLASGGLDVPRGFDG